ncbi:MAG: HAMP domain-containing histidine kinase, partial [Clostridiaceae bacterium]|nr:HAMP domain-containing histidine kinase [Clostridiaceae bacterium]
LITTDIRGIQKLAYYNSNGELLVYSYIYNDNELLTQDEVDTIKNENPKLITYLGEKISDNSANNTINVVKGIFQGDELIGIVSALLDFNEINKYLTNLIPEKDIFFSIIDDSGTEICCNKELPSRKRLPSAINHILPAFQTSSTGEYTLVENNNLIGLNYPISSIGWGLRVYLPLDDVISGFYYQIIFNMVVFFIIMSVLVYFLTFLKRRVINPVTILKDTINQVVKRNYSARTNIKGNDEIALACMNFDKMTESMEQSYLCRTQFDINLFHEIKTPLNVIFASVQLIENYNTISNMECYKTKISSQMKIIRQNCYRLIRLTGNLLDISKHENGFLKIRPKNYDIVRLVRNITNSIKKYTEAKGIELVFFSESDSLVIACDPDMIERILLNLISNAIKFTDKDGKITIKIAEKEETVLISVKDTGIGIPQSKLDCIFERFNQADDSFNRNPDGSGIGLSLVKALVEAHKGNISVQSKVMEGTEFIIALPKKTIEIETDSTQCKCSGLLPNFVSRINIEFSDIYSDFEDVIDA